MAKQKAKSLDVALLRRPQKEQPELPEKPVAMTLKLPHELYIRLKHVAASRKSKGQAIMLDAVREYLDRIAS